MGKAAIFSDGDVKTLKQNIDLFGIAKILTGTDDPTVVAKNANQGSIYLHTGASGGQVFSKQDNGTTTNWTQLSLTGSMPSTNASSTTVVTSATTTYVTAITTTITTTATSVPVWAVATATLTTTTAASVAKCRVTINGVAGQEQLVSLTATATNYTAAVEYISASLGPGTYTINFQVARNSGAGTVNFFNGTLDAIALQGATNNGITQLTGDVTAGPGSGSQVATIPAATVTLAQMANLASTNIIVGNASNRPTAFAMSGDATLSNTGVLTVANLAITNAKIANATINLTTKVTGILPVANGGTGLSAMFAAGRIPFSNGSTYAADPYLQYLTATQQFVVGNGPGTGRISGVVLTTDTVTTHIAGNFYSRGTNTCLQGQNENTVVTIAAVNAGSTIGASIGSGYSRGTLVARTQSLTGDILFSIFTNGYTGAAFTTGSSSTIDVLATENSVAGSQGGEIRFSTTPNGTGTALERIRITQAGHFKSTQASAPTTTTNANAGTGATSSVANATDIAGTLTLTTGTLATAAGVQTTVNFDKAYTVAPIVTITPQNGNSIIKAVIQGIFITSTTAGFSINFVNAETLGTAYTWYYHVIETQ